MDYPFKSNAQAVYRADKEQAERFLRTITPALLKLTGHTGIVSRGEWSGEPVWDVRAMVKPEVADAIYRLITKPEGVGREDVTADMVKKYLEEAHGKQVVGPLADGRGTRQTGDRPGDDDGRGQPPVSSASPCAGD